jgi:hypothetical protein
VFTQAVKEWLGAEWPFRNAAFPGIDIPSGDWDKIEELKR